MSGLNMTSQWVGNQPVHRALCHMFNSHFFKKLSRTGEPPLWITGVKPAYVNQTMCEKMRKELEKHLNTGYTIPTYMVCLAWDCLFIGLRGISPRHCRDSILLVVWTVTTLLQLETENIDIALVATLLSPGSRNPKCLVERIRKSHTMICLLNWKMYVYDITGWRLGWMD